jgi:hypothetical protein
LKILEDYLLLGVSAQVKILTNKNEEYMNELNSAASSSLEWLQCIDKSTNKAGSFRTKDEKGSSIIIEWEKINPLSLRLSEIITDTSHLLVEAYSQIETQFAKKHPEAVPNEMFLKPLADYFKEGIANLDWNIVEEKLKQNLKNFLTTTDWPKYSNPSDIQFFVIAKEAKTNVQLGVIQFIASTEYQPGNFKIGLYDGVLVNENKYNLQKILLGSIFKLVPTTQRIFFHTRITNDKGIDVHHKLGFTPFVGNLAHWVEK